LKIEQEGIENWKFEGLVNPRNISCSFYLTAAIATRTANDSEQQHFHLTEV
jgi:hypothetical protein